MGHQRGLTCLEEAIYHGVGWRDGPNPTVRVPARTEVFHQPFSVRDLEDVGEGAQFVLARLGLSRHRVIHNIRHWCAADEERRWGLPLTCP